MSCYSESGSKCGVADGTSVLGLPSPTSDGDRDRSVAPPDAFASAVPLLAGAGSTTTTSSSLAKSLKSHSVGRVIIEMLPNHLDIPKPRGRVASTTPSASASTLYHHRPPSPAPSHESQASYDPLPLPSPHSVSLSQLASHEQTQAPTPTSTSMLQHTRMQPQVHSIPHPVLCTIFGAHHNDTENDKSDTLHGQVLPVVQLPSTPPSNTNTIATVTPSVSVSGSHSSEQGTLGCSSMFPRVVVVNPTPHPTPPTTPVLGGTASPCGVAFDAHSGATVTSGAAKTRSSTSASAHLLPPLPLPGPVVLSSGIGTTGLAPHAWMLTQTQAMMRGRVPEQLQGPPSMWMSHSSSSTATATTVPDASPLPVDTDVSSILTAVPDTSTGGVVDVLAQTPVETCRFFLSG